MIKLTRPNKPFQLTEEMQAQLTNEFLRNSTSVWRVDFIVNSIVSISNNKCCFCECKLNEESKYLEIEHFNCKSLYPHEVVEWENLLPICKRCNVRKGIHDTKKEPIINPYVEDPREHIFFGEYRLKGKSSSEIGKKTIDVLYLNDTLKLTKVRFDLGERINVELEKLYDLTLDYYKGINVSTRRKNIIQGSLKTLLIESCPDKEYAATAATILLNEEKYFQIKNMFEQKELWDEELTELETNVEFCKLDKG